MGLHGFLRDMLGIGVGSRMMLGVFYPISLSDLLVLGFVLFGMSSWLFLRKFNFVN